MFYFQQTRLSEREKNCTIQNSRINKLLTGERLPFEWCVAPTLFGTQLDGTGSLDLRRPVHQGTPCALLWP